MQASELLLLLLEKLLPYRSDSEELIQLFKTEDVSQEQMFFLLEQINSAVQTLEDVQVKQALQKDLEHIKTIAHREAQEREKELEEADDLLTQL